MSGLKLANATGVRYWLLHCTALSVWPRPRPLQPTPGHRPNRFLEAVPTKMNLRKYGNGRNSTNGLVSSVNVQLTPWTSISQIGPLNSYSYSTFPTWWTRGIGRGNDPVDLRRRGQWLVIRFNKVDWGGFFSFDLHVQTLLLLGTNKREMVLSTFVAYHP